MRNRVHSLPPAPLSRCHVTHTCRYLAFATATVMMAVGLSVKPDTSLVSWAHQEAAKELAAKEQA